MALEVQSEKVACYGFDMGAIQFVWSGADTKKARLTPQISIDGLNWHNMFADSGIKRCDSPAGSQLYTLATLETPWIRLCFDPVNNTTGTLNAYLFLKRRWSPNR